MRPTSRPWATSRSCTGVGPASPTSPSRSPSSPSWPGVSPPSASGGIYWWAAKLGGAKAGYYTGWLNLIGLIAIVASVAYGCATFIDLTLGVFSRRWLDGYSLQRVFVIFLIVLAVAAVINIFSSQLLAILNNISVWWHVVGATIVIAVLFLVPAHHASFSDVFAKTINNTGLFEGATSG